MVQTLVDGIAFNDALRTNLLPLATLAWTDDITAHLTFLGKGESLVFSYTLTVVDHHSLTARLPFLITPHVPPSVPQPSTVSTTEDAVPIQRTFLLILLEPNQAPQFELVQPVLGLPVDSLKGNSTFVPGNDAYQSIASAEP